MTQVKCYQGRHVVSSYLARGVFSLSTGILLTILMLSPWAEFLEDRNLTFHMLAEHIGFTLGAVLISYGSEYIILAKVASWGRNGQTRLLNSIYIRLIKINRKINIHGRIGALVSAFLLAYWHIPTNFNQAVIDDVSHIIMHISIIVVGLMIFANIKVLSRVELVAHAVILGQAMLVGGIVLIITPVHFYLPYPITQQAETGLAMAAPHPFILASLLVYAITHYLWRE